MVLLAGFGAIGFVPSYVESAVPALRRRAVDRKISRSELTVSPETRVLIADFMARRLRWGAVGAGLGGIAAGCAGLWIRSLSSGFAGPLVVALIYAGQNLGLALASATSPRLPSDAVRLSSLQPRGFTDYLRRGEVLAELMALVAGLGVLACGGILLGGVAVTADHNAGVLEATVGLVIVIMCVVALILQRRLLQTPRPADGDAAVVANDFVLATGLRDLLSAVLTTAFSACYGAAVLLDSPVSVPLGAIALCLFLTTLMLDLRHQPVLTPVAHRLLRERAVARARARPGQHVSRERPFTEGPQPT